MVALKFVLSILLAFILVGCLSVNVKNVALQEPIDIKAGVDAKPLLFKKIVVKLPRGREIGVMKYGIFCGPNGAPLTWKGGKINITSDDFTEIFREELEKANFPLVGDPNALFDDPSEWRAELLIAGMINEITVDLCCPMAGYGNFTNAKGEAYIKVEWQIYSRLDRKVVFTTTTEGSGNLKKATSNGALDIMLNAFAHATQNLLANQNFHDLVVRKKDDEKIKPIGDEVSIVPIANSEKLLTENINDVRASVVTVYAGDGHGSGFFISEKGYLLTNEHVVREAKFVKVKLATGRKVLGDVIKVNSKRDVALIKIEESNAVALPIKNGELNIGNEVYAIGSPLDDDLNTSVSKGIVSAYRIKENLKFIQSDVNVLPGNSGGPLLDKNGNVIGITASGIVFHESPSGINFFIPIQDALFALNIKSY